MQKSQKSDFVCLYINFEANDQLIGISKIKIKVMHPIIRPKMSKKKSMFNHYILLGY